MSVAVTPKETLNELQWLSDRLSNQVRLVATGVLALCWGLIITPPATLGLSARALLVVSLLALATMVLDLLQYVVGYINTLGVHRRALRDADVAFDRSAPLYRLRMGLFWGKQILAGVAFLALLAVLLPSLLTRS